MKKWNQPKLTKLDIVLTEAGGQQYDSADNVVYTGNGLWSVSTGSTWIGPGDKPSWMK